MSADRKFKLNNAQSGAALAVRVISDSSRNEIVGIMEDGRLKIQLTGSGGGGQTNRMLIQFLAKRFDLEAGKIEIIAGESQQDKLVVIVGADAKVIDAKIKEILAKP